MDKEHLDELISVEQNYWWHLAKQELLLALVQQECPPPARILEAGMGSGNNLLALQRRGYTVSGLDQLQAAVNHCRSLGINDVQTHDIEQAWPTENTYDIVVLLDVIEHCQNPVQVLQHAKHVLSSGGKIILSVPTIPFLIGPWDNALGHKRRYTLSLLKENAKEAGLALTWHSYWNSFSLLPALTIRSIEKIFCVSQKAEFPRLPNFLNNIFIQLAKIERQRMQKASIPFGLSLIGVMTP